MRVTKVSPIFPNRNNQQLNREDSENTANRRPPKGKKKGEDKGASKKSLSQRLTPSDCFSISSFAQEVFNRRNLEVEVNLDDWAGL